MRMMILRILRIIAIIPFILLAIATIYCLFTGGEILGDEIGRFEAAFFTVVIFLRIYWWLWLGCIFVIVLTTVELKNNSMDGGMS